MKIYIVSLLFFLLLGFGIQHSAMAQTNYSTVKVDELSDAKIKELIQRAESIGYNDAQLEQMAAAQGMKQEEILKLRKRVESIRKQEGTSSKAGDQNKTNDPQTADRQYNNGLDSNARNQPSKEELINKAFEDLKPKIFGSELFKNSNITFEPNLRIATPPNYVIGPDDELLIDISGDNEANYRLKVSPDGNIRVEYAGVISVGGLTVTQAISKIRNRLTAVYPAMRTSRTSLAVNLGNIRSISVILNGNVVKPGKYTISSLSSVYNALSASGGPSENGSFRKIQVIRNGEVKSTIDVYKFLLYGQQTGNIRLQDQDVINIPAYQNRVEVVGEVKTPAIFETMPGETFKDVLNFASGFSTMAYQGRVKVFQNTDKERKITDIPAAEFDTYQPKNGDKFFVEPILDRFENRVEIEGAVFRPGQYALEKGLTLSGLIKKAEGLKEEAFLNRGYISRLNADNTTSLVAFDLSKVLAGTENDYLLQREDKVTISSIFDLREEYKVTITGEVREPGEFDYATGTSLEDLIQQAGGFKEGATPSRIQISRRIKNSDARSANASTAQVFTVSVDKDLKLEGTPFILQPFDIVTVRNSEGYETQKQVFIEGEVLYPGPYTIESKDERISDLIKKAGGLTPNAYTDGASLRRPGPKGKDKNALSVDEEEKEKERIKSLNRLQVDGTKLDITKKDSIEIVASDLVGINLTKLLAEPKTRIDLILEEGDIIRVPKQLQTVKVSGEILNPNNIVYAPGRSFKSYINGAGGYGPQALRSGAFIKYANGSAKAASSFLFFRSYPKVLPGAEILVPKRPYREPLSAQSWIGIGTAFASLAAIIVTIIK